MAYEYEFDGDSQATTYGYNINTPSIKGGTGVFELGIRIKPGSNDRNSLDLSVQTYVGKREGITGTVQYRHTF